MIAHGDVHCTVNMYVDTMIVVGLCRNVIHGSDAVESGKKEIALWFPEGTVGWRSSLHSWIYE